MDFKLDKTFGDTAGIMSLIGSLLTVYDTFSKLAVRANRTRYKCIIQNFSPYKCMDTQRA